MPMTGLPPKLRKVDQQTSAGRKEKAVGEQLGGDVGGGQPKDV